MKRFAPDQGSDWVDEKLILLGSRTRFGPCDVSAEMETAARANVYQVREMIYMYIQYAHIPIGTYAGPWPRSDFFLVGGLQ